jgi:threonine dehydratase
LEPFNLGPTPADIERAHAAIRPAIRRTPVVQVEVDLPGGTASVALKLELLQKSGSFKARGALHTLLTTAEPPRQVVAASGGNHGAAVALAAREIGAAAEIFVPSIAAPVKLARIRDYGATVTVVDGTYADAKAAADRRIAQTGALSVPAFDDARVIAGQGTAALEFSQDAALDTLLVAVGGGGLASGCAAWFNGQVRIVTVETQGTASLAAALKAGQPVDVPISGLAADSLGARRVGTLPFALLQPVVQQALVVTDADVAAAQSWLWSSLRVMAEPGGATALAALLSGAYRPSAGERVGLLVCGGNVDPASIQG